MHVQKKKNSADEDKWISSGEWGITSLCEINRKYELRSVELANNSVGTLGN